MKGFIPSFWLSSVAFLLMDAPFSGPLSPPNWDVDAFLKISCGLFAVIGHMYPIFAKFKGGKGAATACGMLFGVEPVSIAISFTMFGLIILITKYVSLASITATLLYPINLLVMRYGLDLEIDGSIIVFAIIVAIGIIYRHRSNIERLKNGTESKVGQSKEKIESDVEQQKIEV